MARCQERRQLFSSVLVSSVGHVCYYWLHESHAAFMVSDLSRKDNWQGWRKDEKDLRERMSLGALF